MEYNFKCERKDGKLGMHSTNDGFSAIEIYGMLMFKANDIAKQINGEITPDIITRLVVVDDKPISISVKTEYHSVEK